MSPSKLLSLALLGMLSIHTTLITPANVVAAAGAQAQVASYSSNDHSIAVNVPASTAAGTSQQIFFQITAPSGTRWAAFGQGSGMSGANMFVIYASSDNNVTVSPRLGAGHAMPQFNPDAQISVLEGTGVAGDGSLVANIRCDTCLSWGGGETMDPTDSSSSWIFAYQSGDAMSSDDTSAAISLHDSNSGFNLDLTQGTGGASENPLIPAQSTGTGAAPSATSGVSVPVASSGSDSSSASSEVSDNTGMVRKSHAVIMSLIFLIFFPLGALMLYLPYSHKVRFVHAPLQLISLVLLIVGLATGVVLGNRVGELDAYHQIIGYLIVAALVLFQPALGIYQHLRYCKTGGRSPMSIVHRWLGRCIIILGIINGGLGFMQAGPVGNDDSPSWAVVTYCIVAGVVFFVYLSVLLAVSYRAKHPSSKPRREKSKWGYAMNSSQGSSPQMHSPPRYGNENTYISNPRTNPRLGQGAARQQYR
jgi:Cytochrome domain of cellobiose dehydrogenase/Eukaryotic cytochrome b561